MLTLKIHSTLTILYRQKGNHTIQLSVVLLHHLKKKVRSPHYTRVIQLEVSACKEQKYRQFITHEPIHCTR